MRRAALILASLLLLAGLGLGGARVASLEGGEVDRAGEAVVASDVGDDVLVRARLGEGQRAFFEVCADDGFAGDWSAVAFEAWHLGDDARAQRVEAERWLERATAGPDGSYGCAIVLTWESVLVGGEYGLRLAGAPPAGSRVRGRVVAWKTLDRVDRAAVLLTFLGGVFLLLGLALRPRAPRAFDTLAAEDLEDERTEGAAPLARWTERPAWLRVVVGVVALLGVMIGMGLFLGNLFALVRALVLASVQIAVAAAFVAPWATTEPRAGDPPPASYPPRQIALGLVRPRPSWWIVLVAPVLGLVVWIAGGWVSRLIPSTGVSPVETLVSLPSGALAVGVVAVIVPIAEELFFRGFVYGELERRHGRAIAIVVATALFAVVHLPQQWGAWGPVASVAFTGLVLTLLRAYTGSTAVSSIAHLTHNALITALALA